MSDHPTPWHIERVAFNTDGDEHDVVYDADNNAIEIGNLYPRIVAAVNAMERFLKLRETDLSKDDKAEVIRVTMADYEKAVGDDG